MWCNKLTDFIKTKFLNVFIYVLFFDKKLDVKSTYWSKSQLLIYSYDIIILRFSSLQKYEGPTKCLTFHARVTRMESTTLQLCMQSVVILQP